MDHLKEHIEERLWDFIKRNYNSENYTNAILDAIQFIGDIIREKSGLMSDGNPLIGSAFGGKNPKIKLNKLKSESEKNIQKGMESILRGIYSAYRNPRSHSKIQDTEETAYEVIIFLNHILKLIDKSKGKFTTDLFLQRVFDSDFVQSKQYSNLLVKDIPKGKYFEIAIQIFRDKEMGRIDNLSYVWNSINLKLNDAEKKELLTLASEELRYTESSKTVIRTIALFKNEWEKLDEDARLRSENKLIKNLSDANKDIYGQINQSGVYATWLTTIIEKISLKVELADALFILLKSDVKDKQRYAIECFGRYIVDLEKHLLFDSFIELLKNGLIEGNTLMHSFAEEYFSHDDPELGALIENFTPKEIDNELPF